MSIVAKAKIAKDLLGLAWDIGKWVVGQVQADRAERSAHPTHRDAEHIAKAGRCAGHESEPQCYPARPPKGIQ